MMASVGSRILGMSRSSKRTSRGPYSTAPRIGFLLNKVPRPLLKRVVSRLLVELLRLLKDVRLINLLRPFLRLYLFDRDRNRLLAVIQNGHHVVGDSVGELTLLLVRFAGPELHDNVRHC